MNLSRRTFLKTSAIWAGGVWMVGYSTAQTPQYQILTPEEVEIMDALADRIIPPGDYAGGKEAMVTRFIDQQLGEYLHRDRDMYKTCLPALNKSCRKVFDSVFTKLDEERQIAYLTEMEAGGYDDWTDDRQSTENGGWGNYSPSSFFNTLRDHCMMGFYGHPRHGGNKDYLSYQMLGLPVEQEPIHPGRE